MSKTVYLAGPISGQSYAAATDWRTVAERALNKHSIASLSPMRGKAYLSSEQMVADHYPDKVLCTVKGITTRDRWDVMRCDVVLMYLAGAERVSVGTMIELGWADACRKPVVAVMEGPGNPHWHGMVREIAGFVVPTLDEALGIVVTLLR